MPHLTLPVDSIRGPMISLFMGVSVPRGQALKNAGQPVPVPIVVDFLVDTGASCTVIDQATLAPLGLVATGSTHVVTPTTGGKPELRDQFDVVLMLYHADNSRVFQSLPVISTDLSAQKIGGLLGRDVLEKCLLVYDGSKQSFCLAF
jgi:Aspartyl protease